MGVEVAGFCPLLTTPFHSPRTLGARPDFSGHTALFDVVGCGGAPFRQVHRGTTETATGSTVLLYYKNSPSTASQNVGDVKSRYLEDKIPGSNARFAYYNRDIPDLSKFGRKIPKPVLSDAHGHSV